MRKLLIAILAVLLAACGSIDSLSKNKPVLSATSRKAPADYARCAHAKWIRVNALVTMVDEGNSYKILLPDMGGGLIFMLDVQPSPSGSSINLYKRSGIIGLVDSFKDASTACL